MAKRRKQYRGTPEQHRKHALYAAKGLRNTLSRARGFIVAGNCNAAFNSMRVAEWVSGLYAANAGEMGMGAARSRPASRFPYRQYGTAQARAVSSAWKKFAAKCLR